MHTLGQKRPSVPTRKAFCHFIILLKVQAKSSKVKLNMCLSALHTSANGKQEKNTRCVFQSPKVHWANAPETYMIISLASNSSGNLPPNPARDPAQGIPLKKMPSPCWSDHLCGHQPALPPLILWTLHLQIFGTCGTASHKEGGLHLECRVWYTAWPGGETTAQATTAQAELPIICAWSARTHSPKHRGKNSAHQDPRNPAHCSPGHATDGAHSQHAPWSAHTCWTNGHVKVHVTRTS